MPDDGTTTLAVAPRNRRERRALAAQLRSAQNRLAAAVRHVQRGQLRARQWAPVRAAIAENKRTRKLEREIVAAIPA